MSSKSQPAARRGRASASERSRSQTHRPNGPTEGGRGSYLTFAGYNAGHDSVKRIERYGDSRDPKVDTVDWVEQIPSSETRNYVQRIMENMQVYRARFGGGTKLQIEADLHRSASIE
jgi:soluble lytic murein transglycosylase